jgi:hypothetical protein
MAVRVDISPPNDLWARLLVRAGSDSPIRSAGGAICRAGKRRTGRGGRAGATTQKEDGRRILVRAILAAGLSPPERLAGDILAALASAGVFRLRGVLVGTSAYQIYPALLATRLPASAMRTGDLDVAQDYGVSMALGDALDVEFLDCLRQVSSSFRSISDPFDPTAAASYIDDTQFRVDVLTTNRGGAARGPTHLPSLRTRATRLRFLDFLLRDAIVAAVLHRSGVLVNVPRPERYAVHKMIVAAERGAQSPKADKDIVQAESLILALADKRRADDLAEVYVEALDRGAHWRQRLEKSRRRLGPTAAAVLPAG